MTSLGFIVGAWATGIVAGICLIVICAAFWFSFTDRSEYGGAGFSGGIAAGVLVITLGLAAYGFYPYDMQYHRYVPVQGTVNKIESRLLGDGDGGTTAQFVVQLREPQAAGQVYRCDDSRCALVHTGDWISLWCIRDYVYASTPGWRCNFDNTKATS